MAPSSERAVVYLPVCSGSYVVSDWENVKLTDGEQVKFSVPAQSIDRLQLHPADLSPHTFVTAPLNVSVWANWTSANLTDHLSSCMSFILIVVLCFVDGPVFKCPTAWYYNCFGF